MEKNAQGYVDLCDENLTEEPKDAQGFIDLCNEDGKLPGIPEMDFGQFNQQF